MDTSHELNMDTSHELNIGMLAPTSAGKTSLMTAIRYDVKDKLSDIEEISFEPLGITRDNIKRATNEFIEVIQSPDAIFITKGMTGTRSSTIHQFDLSKFSESGSKCISKINILDYAGGILNTTDSDVVKKKNALLNYLFKCQALLIPISSDILMEYDYSHSPNCREKNIDVRNTLAIDDIIEMSKKWIRHRAQEKKNSILIFVPIKCEAYFNDNGGIKNESECLHNAVKEMYLDALCSSLKQEEDNIKQEIKTYFQIETYAVDTYGVVELIDVDYKNNTFSPRFKIRSNCGNNITPLGAYEVFARIVDFNLNDLDKEIEINTRKTDRLIKERGILKKIYYKIFDDPDSKKIKAYNKTRKDLEETRSIFKEISEKSISSKERIKERKRVHKFNF